MSKENQTEVSIDTASYRLHVLQRELSYHQAVHVAATAGLEDCLEIHYDPSAEKMDAEDCEHVSAWAKRVEHANSAVAEVASQVAQAAMLLSELTRCAPAGETQN